MTWSELIFWFAVSGLLGTTFGYGFALGWELRRLSGRALARLDARLRIWRGKQ